MQTLIRLLGIVLDLVQKFVNQREAAKRDAEVKAIQNDPAGEFMREFGGVPTKPTEAPMPSDKAVIEIDER